jgi:hypothetical protein
MFQCFTVIVNNMRADVVVLPYDDHDRAVKLLHSLDRTVWSGKVEAILESKKFMEQKENKRKFMEHKAQHQERSQRQRSFGHPMSRFQAPRQYRTQSQATGPQGPRTQFKPYNNRNTMKPPQSNTSQVIANNNNNSRVCFNCRETGHFIANCPYAKKPTTSAFSNSVNGPRPLVSRANRVPVRSTNNFGNNNNQQMRQPQQSYERARVNHINAHEAQEAQGVVLCEFLVSSVLATILFDEHHIRSYPQVLWKNITYLQYY